MTSGDFFERIESQYRNQRPFIIYRKPNDKKVKSLLQNTNELFFVKDFTEKGFVFSPFDNSEKTVLIPNAKADSIDCSSWDDILSTNHVQTPSNISDESKKQHIDLVENAVAAIKNNDFKKVVLSRQELIKLSETNPISIFKNLLTTYRSAFTYCWYHPKVGLWLGATPETLLKIEGRRFSMMALAATQVYKGNLDVNWSEKEIEEQQLVTDFILENLESLADSKKVSDASTVKAGNLVHLKTMITAQLKEEVSLKKAVNILHPTPAVCGLPKNKAKQFILQHEHYNREFYTGFLGELNFETKKAPRSGKRNIENRAYTIKGNCTQLYVNLRCMQIKGNQGVIYIGGGITESSDPAHEWEETVSKSLVIRNVL